MDPGTRKLKDVLRVVHMMGAFVLVVYVYLPQADTPLFSMAVKIGAVPLLFVTGSAMKHASALRKRFAKTSQPSA